MKVQLVDWIGLVFERNLAIYFPQVFSEVVVVFFGLLEQFVNVFSFSLARTSNARLPENLKVGINTQGIDRFNNLSFCR